MPLKLLEINYSQFVYKAIVRERIKKADKNPERLLDWEQVKDDCFFSIACHFLPEKTFLNLIPDRKGFI